MATFPAIDEVTLRSGVISYFSYCCRQDQKVTLLVCSKPWGSWLGCRPGQQSQRGGKINIWNL